MGPAERWDGAGGEGAGAGGEGGRDRNQAQGPAAGLTPGPGGVRGPSA